ncbi:MAG TPA: NAD(P)-binding domain-containing protein [Flavihumibacter sp.]|nr:NAD(P)-binding domain-containing protein [Bacteroidota bacterium]HOA38544.1 NAD(P)-binding domain-containing protein [Flavihumibacter sp.]HPZ88654.1 NAD(P)-binding domain-containing protein [Flavihumibacter sp.]HQD08857.1 NAD(P)-binding domain-containing protein [Flavihumibacter sp.]
MRFAIIGSGSWATALAKIVSDNGHPLHWFVRNENLASHIQQRKHNPHYLSSATLNTDTIQLTTDLKTAVTDADVILLALPSAYVVDTLSVLSKEDLAGKKIVSAVKGMVPAANSLLNDWLQQQLAVPLSQYYTLMGPCHAEEVANEKLSYLTFSGLDTAAAASIAQCFSCYYINTVVNDDVIGVQYAAILKNIYALGAGIAHGLEYGDNFQSVLIANCADEMAGFLQRVGIKHVEVGGQKTSGDNKKRAANYAASVYLGDLLVTCYSLFSRNRTFGNMIGKGYSVISAQLEMNMVAEGYNASKSIFTLNQEIGAEMPIAATVYKILWEQLPAAKGFKQLEENLI